MFTWGLCALWFCVGLFVANAIWLVISCRGRRAAEREHDSICERISRDGRSEIDRLRGIIATHEDTIRDHKEQIANLKVDREKYAIRMLSLEDSYSEKCVESDAKGQELKEIKQRCSDAWRFLNLDESIITMPTFQPKRPEDQPQKPMCDN